MSGGHLSYIPCRSCRASFYYSAGNSLASDAREKKLSYGIVAVTPRRDKGELDPAGPNLGFHGNDISSRWP